MLFLNEQKIMNIIYKNSQYKHSINYQKTQNNRWSYCLKLLNEKIHIYKGNVKTMHIEDITGMYFTYSSDGAFIMIDKIFKSFDVEYV